MKNRRVVGGSGASRRHLQIARTSLATSRVAGDFEVSWRFLQDSHPLRQLSAKRLISLFLADRSRPATVPRVAGHFEAFRRLLRIARAFATATSRVAELKGSAERLRRVLAHKIFILLSKGTFHFKFHHGIRSGMSFENSRPLRKLLLSFFS